MSGGRASPSAGCTAPPPPAPPGSRSRPVEQGEHGVGVLHPVLTLDGGEVVERHHGRLPPVRPVPQHLRKPLPARLLGRVPLGTVREPVLISVRLGTANRRKGGEPPPRRFPGSGAPVVGSHEVSKSSGLGMPSAVSHSRASIADAAMCDAWATVPHAPDEPKPTSVKSSSPGSRRVMLNSTRYSGRSSAVMSRPLQ